MISFMIRFLNKRRNTMSSMTEYKCPSCGSTLDFNPEREKLFCKACGNEYEIEAIKAFTKASDNEKNHIHKKFNLNEYRKAKETYKPLEGVNVYVCQSCGAAIEADTNTVATKCPYCDSNVIMTDRVSGNLTPNAIIPFKVTPKDLPDLIRSYCKGKKLLPGGFFDGNKIGQLRGIYVPFWLFDCHADGEASYMATRVIVTRQGKYDCYTTSYYLLEREGDVRFKNIPVDASQRMDNDLMDSVEPFDFNELVDFDKAYLSGFLAESFDTDPDIEMERASDRMNTTMINALQQSAAGYNTVIQKSGNINIDQVDVRYVLLPVYLLNCKYDGKNYRYAINGQTGKIVGELPVSRKKCLAYFGAVAAGVFAAVFAVLQLLL